MEKQKLTVIAGTRLNNSNETINISEATDNCISTTRIIGRDYKKCGENLIYLDKAINLHQIIPNDFASSDFTCVIGPYSRIYLLSFMNDLGFLENLYHEDLKSVLQISGYAKIMILDEDESPSIRMTDLFLPRRKLKKKIKDALKDIDCEKLSLSPSRLALHYKKLSKKLLPCIMDISPILAGNTLSQIIVYKYNEENNSTNNDDNNCNVSQSHSQKRPSRHYIGPKH